MFSSHVHVQLKLSNVLAPSVRAHIRQGAAVFGIVTPNSKGVDTPGAPAFRPNPHRTRDATQCDASKWDLLMWMGVSTLHVSNIKGKTFQFVRALRPASCVDWASPTQLFVLRRSAIKLCGAAPEAPKKATEVQSPTSCSQNPLKNASPENACAESKTKGIFARRFFCSPLLLVSMSIRAVVFLWKRNGWIRMYLIQKRRMEKAKTAYWRFSPLTHLSDVFS